MGSLVCKTWHNSTNGTATYATLYIGEVTEYLMGMVWRCKVMDSSGNVEYSRAVYLKRNTTLWINTYNSDGLRVSRTNGESTYNYTYLNGQLTHLTVDGHTMYFYYGADGTPMALSFNGVRYYYVTSLQGDITAIVDQTGTVVTTYLYDAWGNHLHVTGSLSATVGRYNPLRYRGYVYDRETGRFINGDGFTTTGQGIIGNNMFAYCGNNPVLLEDNNGAFFFGVRAINRLIKKTVKTTMSVLTYWNNSSTDRDSSSTTRNKIINDQKGVTGQNFTYGMFDASWNGCEVIAVHNAKVLLNLESSLSQTMYAFQSNGAMIGKGFFGSYPQAIGRVLHAQGINYSGIQLNEMDKNGVYIISYWNENAPWNGIHTVAVSYDGATYTTYNYSGNGETSNKNPAEYACDYICGYYLGGA